MLVTLNVPPVRVEAGAVSAVTTRSGRMFASYARTNVWPLDHTSGAWIHVTLGVPAGSTVIHGVWLRRCVPETPVPVPEPVPTSLQRPTRESQPST